MKKYLVVSSALMFVSMFSIAQSTRNHIEKALTSPGAAESSAKADAMLIDKKAIKDSSTYDAGDASTRKDNKRLFKRKKKSLKKDQYSF